MLVGHRYEYNLYTHCGVKFLGLDGDVWRATQPLGDGNVPPGWRTLQPGVIEIVSENVATWSDDYGREVTFRRLPHHPGVGCA